jgi:PKD repeat protein
MKKFFSITMNVKWLFAAILLLGIVSFNACTEDEPEPGDDPIASFQYEVNVDNFLEVAFTNFSQNADAYAWDFGDGNTSTEESPTYTYAEAGTYTVSLTATGAEGTTPSTKSETITITDPNSQLTLIAGASSKKWYLNREGVALGIGQGIGNNNWWSFGGVTPLGDRPCILDDYYEFHRDGTFTINTGGTVFVDSKGNGGWLDAEACVDESETDKLVGENGEDLSIYATGGDFGYTFDATSNLMTITGEGSYIGLPNKTNTGDSYIPTLSKEYEVFNLVEGEIADSLFLGMVINGDPEGAGVWNFYLVSYHDENDLPDIPSALPTASFSFAKEGNVVTFTNTSKNATSYSWDFGDGGTSTDKDPVYTYAADGDYTVTLTAMDDNGNSDENSQVISISSAVFSPAVLSSAEGKVWVLDGVASFYVGDAIGSNAWWAGITEADLVARACMLDDEFIFFDDGSFVVDTKGEVFAEGYMGGSDACIADGDLPAPYDGLASGNYTFVATDENVRVIGDGAYIGFSKAYMGGEYSGSDAELAQEINYFVHDYTSDAEKELLWVAVDISGDQSGTAWWTMRMVSYK